MFILNFMSPSVAQTPIMVLAAIIDADHAVNLMCVGSVERRKSVLR